MSKRIVVAPMKEFVGKSLTLPSGLIWEELITHMDDRSVPCRGTKNTAQSCGIFSCRELNDG